MNDDIKNTLAVIPQQPGCYQFFDEKGTVIYVGKAKDLKRRVSSYFNKHHDHPKTRILVRNIRKIKYIVVNTEEDTFLLENNLIKELKPRYNVMLKDDKTYPSIVIKNEFFPRVYKTRNVVKDGSKYYGPYTSVLSVNVLILEKFIKLELAGLILLLKTLLQRNLKFVLSIILIVVKDLVKDYKVLMTTTEILRKLTKY